jgi:hypothetical protein
MTVQLKEKSHHSKPATAGPSADDRFGAGPIATNAEARIIKGDIVGGRTRITIARGAIHGVRADMEGHVTSGGQTIATFQIDQVKPNVSYAFTSATIDRLDANAMAVINPTRSHAPPTHELRSRVIHVQTDPAGSRITIARGSDHGIHRGMRGTLVSNTGAEHYTFTIELVDGNRSYATVETTVAEVNNFPNVILRPLHAKHAAAIQRRATGNASTADVQATADAGVASASSRLPHFDTIQRAFGKHDISNVQSQVGGAATPAAASLGAQAYATGNRVAFASSPDLHTAAHEAAHTIQQRHGAVGFQGLGAADDEHEHHADAVADAVAAGQSAEPLLDKLVGGSPTTAIQRKEAPNARFEAVRAILLAAEDSVVDLSAETAVSVAIEATRYLKQALAVLNEANGGIDRIQEKALGLELRRAGRALERVRGLAHPETKQETNALAEMRATEERLRFVLGVDVRESNEVGDAEPNEPQPHLVAAMLEVIANDAARAYSELDDDKDRHSVIARVSATTRRNVAFVYTELGRASDPKQYASVIEAASTQLLKLRRWVVGRPAHAALINRLQTAMNELDRVRELAGLGVMMAMDAPPISERAVEQEQAEQHKIETALSRFDTATHTTLEVYKLGVQRFEAFAALKRPAPKGDAFEAFLLKALVTLGLNIVTPGIGTFVGRFVALGLLSETSADVLSKTSAKMLTGQVEGAVKTIVATKPEKPDSNESVRERRYFVETLIQSQLITIGVFRTRVHEMVEKQQISATEIAGMTATLDTTSAELGDKAYREAAHSFATLQAEKGFSYADERDGRKSPDPMAGYLDKDLRGAPRKEGTFGVGRVGLQINQVGEDLKVTFKTFEIHGMNDDVALAILQRGQYRLGQIQLPLEIEMLPPRWAVRNWIDLPFFVVDADAQVRAARNWEAITESLAARDWQRPRDANLIATPQAAWDAIRGAKLDPAVVRARPIR